MDIEALKILILTKYYDHINEKIKTRIIPDDIKSEITKYTSFYINDLKGNINTRCWFILKNITELKKCFNCNESIHPSKLSLYYTQNYCSIKCSASHDITRKKYENTCIEKYGVSYVFQNNEIKEKIKQTNIEKYGVEYISQNDIVKEKIKQTNIERYGVDHPLQCSDIQEKIKQTNIERYGVESSFQNNEIKEKIKQTNIEKYGVEYPIQCNEIQEKIKQTNIERYGVENISQNDKIKEKSKETRINGNGSYWTVEMDEKYKKTSIERYGVEHPSQNPVIKEKIINTLLLPEIKEKTKQTNIERYGVEHPSQNPVIKEKIINTLLLPEIKEKIKQTNIERYGVPYFSQSHLSQDTINIINDSELFCEYIKDKTVYEISKDLKIDSATIYNYIKKYNAYYKTTGPTYLESEMSDFLTSIGIEYEINNRTILDGKELNFYIPSMNIAIEMNGLYYHSDKILLDKNYHYNKWKSCYDRGIHLVSIFEDDWKFQQEKICNMLLTFFNKKQKGIHARKSNIKQIDVNLAKPFLEQYHLQGFVGGKHYGAFDGENLIGVMTFGYTRNQRFELKRFVMDNYSHPGLFSKIFKYAQKELSFNEIVSFSDNSCFTGNVYKQNGFDFVQVIKPDYRYIFNKKRIHKSNFKKSNIISKFSYMSDFIDNGMSESKVMEYLGIPKIWDCGKCEWVWKST